MDLFSSHFRVRVKLENGRVQTTAAAMIDSGATGSCINRAIVEQNKLETRLLDRPMLVHNADGSPNKEGPIKEYVELHMSVDGRAEVRTFTVTNLGKADL